VHGCCEARGVRSRSRLELAPVHYMLRDLLVVVFAVAIVIAPMALAAYLEPQVTDDAVPER